MKRSLYRAKNTTSVNDASTSPTSVPADRAALLDLPKCSGSKMDPGRRCRPYRRRPADFFRGYNRQGNERRHISAEGNDEPVHRITDVVGLPSELCDPRAGEASLSGQIELGVRLEPTRQLSVAQPATAAFSVFDSIHASPIPTMPALGGHPRMVELVSGSLFARATHPWRSRLVIGHHRHQTREVLAHRRSRWHTDRGRVGSPSQSASGSLQILDLHADTRLNDAVLEKHVLV